MDDKLFQRVTFENQLMSFFNQYCKLSDFAMTTASIKTREDYADIRSALSEMSELGKELIKAIPEAESKDFKDETSQFLKLISERLDNIAERYIHLEAKRFGEESYSFFQDGEYRKKDRQYEKAISSLGERMNYYKDETKRMMEL